DQVARVAGNEDGSLEAVEVADGRRDGAVVGPGIAAQDDGVGAAAVVDVQVHGLVADHVDAIVAQAGVDDGAEGSRGAEDVEGALAGGAVEGPAAAAEGKGAHGTVGDLGRPGAVQCGPGKGVLPWDGCPLVVDVEQPDAQEIGHVPRHGQGALEVVQALGG